jgi:hypothetical protein
MKEHKKLIQHLNDVFRQTFNGGKVVLTKNISILPSEELSAIIHQVQTYNNFNKGNDPYGEHDFGSLEHNGNTIFWKIDYYDSEYCFFSNNPACPDSTNRVLTIMFAHEY